MHVLYYLWLLENVETLANALGQGLVEVDVFLFAKARNNRIIKENSRIIEQNLIY